jgi:calcineurin-like phosphoesterase family protein
MKEITITAMPTAQIDVPKGVKVFLIADTHFGHKNIIRYCSRPFDDIVEMNKVLTDNWNKTVKPDDYIIILGDVAPFSSASAISWYLSQLNGIKILINGNHDKGFVTGCKAVLKRGAALNYDGESFVLCHMPNVFEPEVVADRWRIHGHIHDKTELINVADKRMNVCVETIGYAPIELNKLLKKRDMRCRDERKNH